MIAEAFQIGAEKPDELPIRSLISTSEENLRARAERMAIRLTGSDCVSRGHVSAEDAQITTDGRWTLRSRQLRVAHNSLGPEAWANQLRDEFPSVIVAHDDDAIVIDLRWIAAADDNRVDRPPDSD